MIGCIHCNSTDGVITEQLGSLITWKCDACGGENTVHISPAARTLEEFQKWRPPQPGERINRKV